MSQNIRLIVVDDFRLFGECLEAFLAKKEEISVVQLLADPEEALNEARTLQPDIILVNINLPNNKAFELVKQISRELPQVKVIVFQLAEEESNVLKYIEAGATGYVSSESSMQDLIRVIRLVYSGETACSPEIAYSVFSRVAELSRKHRNKLNHDSGMLTAREMEILHLISIGLSNNQIAQQLYLSLCTVKNHVHNILEKLEVRSRSEAVHYASDKGLLKREVYAGKDS